MDDTKQKYIRLKEYDEIIIFPCIMEHSRFRNFNPISAGFCYVDSRTETVSCYGDSFSLSLKSDPKDDSMKATRQVFGIDAMLKML